MRTANLNKKATNLKEVNKAIQAKFPHIELVRGEGYYYITSDDDDTYYKLIAPLYQTAIYSPYLNVQTVEAWVKDVENLLKNKGKQHGTGDTDSDNIKY